MIESIEAINSPLQTALMQRVTEGGPETVLLAGLLAGFIVGVILRAIMSYRSYKRVKAHTKSDESNTPGTTDQAASASDAQPNEGGNGKSDSQLDSHHREVTEFDDIEQEIASIKQELENEVHETELSKVKGDVSRFDFDTPVEQNKSADPISTTQANSTASTEQPGSILGSEADSQDDGIDVIR
jgi:hypothetical protein